MRDRQRREFPGLIFQPATTALLRYCERQRRNDSSILEALAEGVLEHIPPGHYRKKNQDDKPLYCAQLGCRNPTRDVRCRGALSAGGSWVVGAAAGLARVCGEQCSARITV